VPQDAPPNGGAHDDVPAGPWSRVAGMQAKLHRWAAADPGRRLDDLFNFVHDPATLIVAFSRVAGNQGANTPGVDGVTAVRMGLMTHPGAWPPTYSVWRAG
jgi:RNA-directed DNA polymerase